MQATRLRQVEDHSHDSLNTWRGQRLVRALPDAAHGCAQACTFIVEQSRRVEAILEGEPYRAATMLRLLRNASASLADVKDNAEWVCDVHYSTDQDDLEGGGRVARYRRPPTPRRADRPRYTDAATPVAELTPAKRELPHSAAAERAAIAAVVVDEDADAERRGSAPSAAASDDAHRGASLTAAAAAIADGDGKAMPAEHAPAGAAAEATSASVPLVIDLKRLASYVNRLTGGPCDSAAQVEETEDEEALSRWVDSMLDAWYDESADDAAKAWYAGEAEQDGGADAPGGRPAPVDLPFFRVHTRGSLTSSDTSDTDGEC